MYNKLYIYFYDLYSPVASFFLCVCVCVCVRAFVEKRESNHEQTVCVASGYNLGGNSGSFWLLCPCKLNFMRVCVCVCVYTSQFMYNKL